MKHLIRVVVATVLALSIVSLCFAQENTEESPIEVEKVFLGYLYTYEGTPLQKLDDFFPIMENNPDAVSQVKKAKTNRGVSMVFAAGGGFLIGWPLGQAIVGAEDPNWVLAGVGGGLAVVGLVFGVRSDKQLRNGVDLYNEGIALFDESSPEFYIALTRNGIGINMLF